VGYLQQLGVFAGNKHARIILSNLSASILEKNGFFTCSSNLSVRPCLVPKNFEKRAL
jgi:hypothetical protein